MKPKVLMVPGLWNSGPEHWQTLWEAEEPAWRRICQRDWEHPVCAEWVTAVDIAVQEAGDPVVLVAHSLGCAAVAHWGRFGRRIHGALLVAPSDVEAPSYPDCATGFVPLPLDALPFRSVVVASSDDPYVSLDRARLFAGAWGSRFIDIGPRGHIDSSSGLGRWPEGRALLNKLLG